MSCSNGFLSKPGELLTDLNCDMQFVNCYDSLEETHTCADICSSLNNCYFYSDDMPNFEHIQCVVLMFIPILESSSTGSYCEKELIGSNITKS